MHFAVLFLLKGFLILVIPELVQCQKAAIVPSEDDPIEAVTWRLEAVDETPPLDPMAPDAGATVDAARKGSREAYADGRFVEHEVYDRSTLPVDERIAGPAIVEEPESTTLIGPDATFHADEVGNLIVEQ
jgi:N-methylhydantoinase A